MTNNLIHPHANKTYSHTGGKGPAPPVPTFQTQQSAPQRMINDNIQVNMIMTNKKLNGYRIYVKDYICVELN